MDTCAVATAHVVHHSANSGLRCSLCSSLFVTVPCELYRSYPCRAGIRIQPGEQTTNAARGQCHAGVARPVIHLNRVAIRADGLPTGEDDVFHVSTALIGFFRPEHPGVPALQADRRIMKIEESKAQTINASRSRLPHPVIDHQPALGRLDRRRT